MTKKNSLIYIIIVFLLPALVAAGCGSKESSMGTVVADGIPPEIAKVAVGVLDAYMSADWAALYDYIHVDIQGTVTKEDFIRLRTEARNRIKLKYQGYRIEKLKFIKTWRDPANQELLFNNVAEITYTVTVEGSKGIQEIKSNLYLAKGPDGKWAYLWPKN
ncbi:hypothetical protein [Thermincola potens]|uniref:Uncharacterized protein n=1 Tax=Thermincola potens (strain JR) TaxID=635013 RepID=D5XE03_THEPJ|nr:hypothetical protein [Thermincola potens]ADG81874.1 hypothetical protein TherJR_1009 [Thermincola potens JR]